MVISDPRHTECLNLTRSKKTMKTFSHNHENNVPSWISPQWLIYMYIHRERETKWYLFVKQKKFPETAFNI